MGFLDDIVKAGKDVLGIESKASQPEPKKNIVTLLDGSKVNEKDIPFGEIYVNSEGKKVRKLIKQPVAIESKQEMERWLRQLAPSASPAIAIALENQMQVLNNVFSASLAGMAIDNMLFGLQKALNCARNEEEKANLRDDFCMMIQNFVFINEAKLLYASEQNRLEAAQLLGQAGCKMMQCAVNIGMEVIKTAQMSTVAGTVEQGGKAAAAELAKKITTSDTPPVAKNPFEGEEAEKMLGDLAKSLAKKKILEEKAQEFDKMMTNLFPMFDRYYDMIGPSVLVCGMLERYCDKLVEKYEVKLYTGVLSRIKSFQPPKKFLTKAPPTDYDYIRALEIELNAESLAAKKAIEQNREELEEYKTELKKIALNPLKGSRRAELNDKIAAQEREIKQLRDTAEIAEANYYKLEQILKPIKDDVNKYKKTLMAIANKYDINNQQKTN